MTMSERDYIISKAQREIIKGLPSALRAIPKHAEMSNPYIASRVYAHDRGKVAGNLMARAAKEEKRVSAKHARSLNIRNPVTAPFSIAGNEINRHYAMQHVRTTQGMAARSRAQGEWGRKLSRNELANPSPRLVRMADRKRPIETAGMRAA